MSAPPSHERGFTLIELMISLVLFSFAVAGVLSVAVTVTQGYREQRQAIAAEAAVRAPIDFLADALRQASPGVSDPSKLQDFHTCKLGAIEVINSSTGPDELDVFYATGGVVTSTKTIFDASSTTITVTEFSQFVDGDYIIVTDTITGMLAKVTNVSVTGVLTLAPKCSGTLTAWPVTTSAYPVGSHVVRAQHAHFEIAFVGGVPTLMMDPDGEPLNGGGSGAAEPLAENIEDMQVAVGVDDDGLNGIAEVGVAQDDDEWHYNVLDDDPPPAGKAIRAVRVTLVSRTSSPLFGNMSSTFFFPPKAEDHAQGAVDSYRRRTLRTIVELRNIGGSP